MSVSTQLKLVVVFQELWDRVFVSICDPVLFQTQSQCSVTTLTPFLGSLVVTSLLSMLV